MAGRVAGATRSRGAKALRWMRSRPGQRRRRGWARREAGRVEEGKGKCAAGAGGGMEMVVGGWLKAGLAKEERASELRLGADMELDAKLVGPKERAPSVGCQCEGGVARRGAGEMQKNARVWCLRRWECGVWCELSEKATWRNAVPHRGGGGALCYVLMLGFAGCLHTLCPPTLCTTRRRTEGARCVPMTAFGRVQHAPNRDGLHTAFTPSASPSAKPFTTTLPTHPSIHPLPNCAANLANR
eukprot:107447-Chlamydomonas_euryale.AAC.2